MWTSRRGSSCVFGSWQAERGSRRTRRHPRDDSRSVSMSVSLSVSVPWNSSFFPSQQVKDQDHWIRALPAWICMSTGLLSFFLVVDWFVYNFTDADLMSSLHWYYAPALLAFFVATRVQKDTSQQLQKLRRNRHGMHGRFLHKGSR